MTNYPYTQADQTPEADALSVDYYELRGYIDELAREWMNRMSEGHPYQQDDPTLIEWREAKAELERVTARLNELK